MSMSIGFRHRVSYNQKISLREKIEQRIEQRLTLRLALIQKFRGVEFEPNAPCPNCGCRLTIREILKGFNGSEWP